MRMAATAGKRALPSSSRIQARRIDRIPEAANSKCGTGESAGDRRSIPMACLMIRRSPSIRSRSSRIELPSLVLHNTENYNYCSERYDIVNGGGPSQLQSARNLAVVAERRFVRSCEPHSEPSSAIAISVDGGSASYFGPASNFAAKLL